jgi:hypothetical protein
MKELRLLPHSYLVRSEIGPVTNVVMWVKKDDTIRILEKPTQ